MVHGNPTWSFYFRHLVLALRDRHRVIVPDHIGCGLSDHPDQHAYDFRLQSRIDDLDALLESLNLPNRVTLVVHDWGGMIGMAYAARHPEKIRRIVVLNTASFHMPKSKSFPALLWLGRNTALGAWLILKCNAFCRLANQIAAKRRQLTQAEKSAYLMPHDTVPRRISVLKFVQTIPLRISDPGYDLVSAVESSLPKFADVPMLIIWGLKDFIFDHHFLAEWERRFPKAEVHRYARSGHYILEDEREEAIEWIDDFFARHPIPPSGAEARQ
nr:alpha/beta fold hydrolase [Tuwongella immobilis]